MKTKQVIVVRRDLNMPIGKACAQVAHASMAFLTRGLTFQPDMDAFDEPCSDVRGQLDAVVEEWVHRSFKKVCVAVDSEEMLEELHTEALQRGLESHMVTDSGDTVFDGVPTKTCVAIGPHEDSEFKSLTDHLPLL